MVSGVGRNGEGSPETDGAFWRAGGVDTSRSIPSGLVMIASDAPLVAQGLVELLTSKCSELQFELERGADRAKIGVPRPILIVVQLAELEPDDPWLSGFTMTMRRKFPNVPLLLISEIPVSQLAWSPFERGFAGYIPTSQSSDQLVSAIRVLVKGGGLILRSEESRQEL